MRAKQGLKLGNILQLLCSNHPWKPRNDEFCFLRTLKICSITNGLVTCKSLQAFNGKRWEKFNSEKIASLTYARIQGQAALVSHFQNSSLMNEDKRCRPILFQSEGQGIDDLVCDKSLPFFSHLDSMTLRSLMFCHS